MCKVFSACYLTGLGYSEISGFWFFGCLTWVELNPKYGIIPYFYHAYGSNIAYSDSMKLVLKILLLLTIGAVNLYADPRGLSDSMVVHAQDHARPDTTAMIAAQNDVWEYSFENHPDAGRWYWVSFPVLDTQDKWGDLANNVFKPLTHVHMDDMCSYKPTYLREILWLDQGMSHRLNWRNADWNAYIYTHRVTPSQGYKVNIMPRVSSDHPSSATIRINGTKAPDSLSFSIYSGTQNWLGYFLAESQSPEKALAAIWDDVMVAKTKDWCLIRDAESNEMHGLSYPLNCGDMLILVTRNNHHASWGQYQAEAPRHKARTSFFVPDEKEDYVPLFLHMPELWYKELSEIGLYVNGVLKGAVVVEDSLEQISAYIDFLSELTDEEVELAILDDESHKAGNAPVILSLKPGRLEAKYGAPKSRYPFFELRISSEDVGSIAPLKCSLRQNQPNPFKWRTTIAYSLPEITQVQLDVLNLRGQLVRTLVSGERTGGFHSVVWNGKDMNDKAVAAGIYLCRLSCPKVTLSKSMLLMK